MREYGSRLHEDSPSRFFGELAALLRLYRGENYDAILGYAFGMCCHYAYDRTAHPYVLWLEREMKLSDERGENYHYHGEIESMLDIILLRHDKELLVNDISLSACMPADKASRGAIETVYTRLLPQLYGTTPEAKSISQLVPDARAAAKWLNDRTLIKRPMIASLEKLFGAHGAASAYMRPMLEDMEHDYANVGHADWHNIYAPEETSDADFFELTDTAEADSLNMIGLFSTACREPIDFTAFTGERTLSYGVPPMSK